MLLPAVVGQRPSLPLLGQTGQTPSVSRRVCCSAAVAAPAWHSAHLFQIARARLDWRGLGCIAADPFRGYRDFTVHALLGKSEIDSAAELIGTEVLNHAGTVARRRWRRHRRTAPLMPFQ